MSPSLRCVDLRDLHVFRYAARRDGVITADVARRFGFARADIGWRVRRRAWLSLQRGVYFVRAVHDGDDVPRRAWLRAAVAAHPGSVLGLTSAAELLGIDGLGHPDRDRCASAADCSPPCPGRPVQLILPTDLARHQKPHVELHFWSLAAHEIQHADGLPFTGAVRTLADLVPRLDGPLAPSVLDSALHRGAVRPDGLRAAQSIAAGRPGCRHVADLWGLADGRAASALESRIRLACIDHRLAPTGLQVPVHSRWGDLLGYADLGWEKRTRGSRLLVAECDGAEVHGSPQALFRDRLRLNDFTSAQCDQLRFTWADALRPAYVASAVRAAL